MSSEDGFLIFVIFLCLLLSAFFSSSETALFSLNKYKLHSAVLQKRYGAVSAAKLSSEPEKLISMILICNNIVNIIASSLATIVGQSISGDMGIAVATGVLTFVLLIFGEIIPKTIASQNSEMVAYAVSPILLFLLKVTTPIVWIFNLFTKFFFKLFRIKTNTAGNTLSNDELRVIVKESQNLVGKEHSDMLNSILDLEEVTVKQIMIPRHEIACIDIEDDMKAIMRQLNHASTSHVVIYRETFEKQVLGILRIREAYRLMFETNEFTKETLVRAIDKAIYIPEGTTLTRQLHNFKKEKRKIGLVVDEYGYIIGLVTINDILEEIIGNFTVNSVVEEQEDINLISNGKYLIDGQANLRDLNKKFGWELFDDEARTLNGYLLEIFQDIPKVNTQITVNNLTFTIVEVDRKGIVQVQIIDHKRYKGPIEKPGDKAAADKAAADKAADKTPTDPAHASKNDSRALGYDHSDRE